MPLEVPANGNPESPQLQLVLRVLAVFADASAHVEVLPDDLVHQILSPTFDRRNRTKSEFLFALQALKDSLRDFTFTIEDVIEAPGRLWLQALSTATNVATGAPFKNRPIFLFDFDTSVQGEPRLTRIREVLDTKALVGLSPSLAEHLGFKSANADAEDYPIPFTPPTDPSPQLKFVLENVPLIGDLPRFEKGLSEDMQYEILDPSFDMGKIGKANLLGFLGMVYTFVHDFQISCEEVIEEPGRVWMLATGSGPFYEKSSGVYKNRPIFQIDVAPSTDGQGFTITRFGELLDSQRALSLPLVAAQFG